MSSETPPNPFSILFSEEHMKILKIHCSLVYLNIIIDFIDRTYPLIIVALNRLIILITGATRRAILQRGRRISISIRG